MNIHVLEHLELGHRLWLLVAQMCWPGGWVVITAIEYPLQVSFRLAASFLELSNILNKSRLTGDCRVKQLNFGSSPILQNMQCTLSFACIFKFMSLYMHNKNLNMKCILVWQICNNTSMHPHRAPLCWWCHSASPLHVSVGLTWMAVMPCHFAVPPVP